MKVLWSNYPIFYFLVSLVSFSLIFIGAYPIFITWWQIIRTQLRLLRWVNHDFFPYQIISENELVVYIYIKQFIIRNSSNYVMVYNIQMTYTYELRIIKNGNNKSTPTEKVYIWVFSLQQNVT